MRLPFHPIEIIPLVALSLGVAAPLGTASAQLGPFRRDNMTFEIRPFFGSYVPTGTSSKSFPSARLGGLQMSLLPTRHLALTLGFAVAPTRDRAIAAAPQVDLLMIDFGAEWRLGGSHRDALRFCAPFVGAGLGSRSYEYSDSLSNSVSHRDGYVALGGEMGVGVIGIRLEGRDYLSSGKVLSNPSGGKMTLNDFTLSLGIAFRIGKPTSAEPEPRPRALVSNR